MRQLWYATWWLTRDGRRYLFSDLPFRWFGEESKWERVWCRLRGHAGPVFYNVAGLEPDWSCRRCGEDLG